LESAGGAYSAPPDALAALRGDLLLREREGKGWNGGRGEEKKEGE